MTDSSHRIERDDVAIEVDETEVGREVSLYELTCDGWERRYTMPAGQAREYYEMFKEVFPDDD